jgi:hypothetical protein
MALYDWTTEKQANTYTAAANKKRMAAEAGRLLAIGQEDRSISDMRNGEAETSG